ncbi:DUF885 family protein [Streptomyces sp. NPDC018031]|uniref:DUF885 family protein n=1 Tax=Streptomyces sp. NPDC018031 TaxID=3365033 RepID=UPI0037B3AB11
MVTDQPLDARLTALCDAWVPAARDSAGRHEYDGVVQDLSPDGVRRTLAALGRPAGTRPYADPHDEAQATVAEEALRVRFGVLELHRSNPLWHIDNLDLSCYDREYAPEGERDAARRAHLARWPDAVDAAIAALDRVPAPLAGATLPLAIGLTEGLDTGTGAPGAARRAHARFVAHLRTAAEEGPPSAALGATALARLLGSGEGVDVDLEELSARVDAERDRLRALLEESTRRLDPTATTGTVLRRLRSDHPPADRVLPEVEALVDEALRWTEKHRLVPHHDVAVRVLPTPAAQRRALAAASWATAYEPDSPGRFHLTLPRPDWPADRRSEWLADGFFRAGLAGLVVHEVAPGHLSHGRALRRVSSDVRRTVISEAFLEGWAHYCEELALQEGFRAEDPGFAVVVALDALRRVTRFACALGLHTGELTVREAARRFTDDVGLSAEAACEEARRGLFDPTYGRYTWGKLVIQDLRAEARRQWGGGFSLPRFHAAVLALGSPPLGLLRTTLDRAGAAPV